MTCRRIPLLLMMGFSGILSLLFLTSCPHPIPEILALQVLDQSGPLVTLSEPVDRSEYGAAVRVSGSILDGDTFTADRISACEYSVLGTPVAGSFTLDETGVFSFIFPTRAQDGSRLFDGTVTLAVSVRDWNGNVSTVTRELIPGGTGDVLGFSVIPGNGKVSIEWDPVPGAESYDILEYKYGFMETDVTSPFDFSGLENGEVYRFRVRANMPVSQGTDAYSATIEKMPLSPRSLAPWVRETGYGSVTLEWWDDPGIGEYTVERSTAPEGPWQVRRNLTGGRFTDSGLDHDMGYYYRVRSTAFPEIVSDPLEAVAGRFGHGLAAAMPNTNEIYQVAAAGGYAYMTGWSGSSGVLIISDISAPSRPALVSTTVVSEDGEAYAVEILGSYAYLGTSEGLKVVNVADPRNPVVGAALGDPHVQALTIDGLLLYAAGSGFGLSIYDLQGDPASPVLRGSCSFTSGEAWGGMTLEDRYLYLAAQEGSLHIVDVADPDNLTEETPVPTSSPANGVAAAGGYLYVAESDGLSVYDLKEPWDPTKVADTLASPGTARDVTIDGSYVYVADTTAGLLIFSLADPEAPVKSGTVPVSGSARAVSRAAEYCYIGTERGGMAVIRAEGPESPVKVSSSAITSQRYGAALAGNYAYVAAHTRGVEVWSLANAEHPSFLTNVETPGSARGVALGGDYAYVAVDGGGISVVDIGDPAHPVLVRTVETYGAPQDVTAAGPYLYVSDSGGGFSVFSIERDPSHPVPLSITAAGGQYPNRAVVAGSFAYAAAGSTGLSVFDLENPESPAWTSFIGTISSALSVVLSDSYACVATNTSGVRIFDVSDPASPVAAGTVTGIIPRGLASGGPYLYAGDSEGYFHIISLSDPDEPVLTATIGDVPTLAQVVVLRGSLAYVADSTGLTVIRLGDP